MVMNITESHQLSESRDAEDVNGRGRGLDGPTVLAPAKERPDFNLCISITIDTMREWQVWTRPSRRCAPARRE